MSGARPGGRVAVCAILAAAVVHARSPDAAPLLDGAHANFLQTLGGVGAHAVPIIPARYGVQVPFGDALHWRLSDLRALRDRYPGTTFEVAGPLHTLLDTAARAVAHPRAKGVSGPLGRGVIVAVADTGFDLAHADLRSENGATRVLWALDFTVPPRGNFPELETQFGLRNGDGRLVRGAVFDRAAIDEALTSGRSPIGDEEGHGTHVTSLAAGNPPRGPYVGMAPQADLVVVRLAGGAFPDILAEAIERAVAFAFDRAAAERKPCVVNLSVGTDFGPHDGSLAWENAIAEHIGVGRPGRAIVVAAGNGGRVSDGVHQSVALTSRTTAVPFRLGAAQEGTLRVWVTAAPGSTMRLGVRAGPNATTIAPVGDGLTRSEKADGLELGVLRGANAVEDIPRGSSSAIVLVSGRWGAEPPELLLEGAGRAEMWFDAAAFRAQGPAGFRHSVRDGSVAEPAAHPAFIGVGCTVSRPSWTSVTGNGPFFFPRLALDAQGGVALAPARYVHVIDGDVCDFSAAGPSATGVPKPDLVAPGLAIIGAMSSMAPPGTLGSIFTATCATAAGILDSRCLQTGPTHALAFGSSMSAPIVAGAVAMLFEKNALLTQFDVRDLLRASTHKPRGAWWDGPTAGPGELDISSALALESTGPSVCVIDPNASWLTASRSYAPALGDGVTVGLQARCPSGLVASTDGRPIRLEVAAEDGTSIQATRLDARSFAVPAMTGRAGQTVVLRAYLDADPVAPPLVLRVGAGAWDARYGLTLPRGCTMAARGDCEDLRRGGSTPTALFAGLGAFLMARRRRAKT